MANRLAKPQAFAKGSENLATCRLFGYQSSHDEWIGDWAGSQGDPSCPESDFSPKNRLWLH